MIRVILYYNRYLWILNIVFYVLVYLKIFPANVFTSFVISLIIIGYNEYFFKKNKILFFNLGFSLISIYASSVVINLFILALWKFLM